MTENKIGNYEPFILPLIKKHFDKNFLNDLIGVTPMSKEDLLQNLNNKIKTAQKLIKTENSKEKILGLKNYIKWIKQIIKNDGNIFNYKYEEIK